MATDPVTIKDRESRTSSNSTGEIDSPGIFYNIMAEKWDLIEDLMNGTDAMRHRGERWLPKHALEQRSNWQRRLRMSFLFGAFKEVVKTLSSKPFAQTIVMKNEDLLPERLSAIADNPDLTGRNITSWSREVFKTAVQYGLTHVLVDFPINTIALEENRLPTLEEERVNGLRPRFVHVKPRDLIGWDTVIDPITGEEDLIRARIKTERVEATGAKFKEQVVSYISVWTKTDVWKWRKTEEDEEYTPTTDEPISHDYGAIPLATFYTCQTGFMTAEPPLQDLADVNLQHWQTASDISNILHVSRFAFLLAKGIPANEWDTITIGPNSVIKTTSKDASLDYVEHKGTAIGTGMSDLEKQEERMERLGLNPLIRRSGSQTATSAVISNDRTQSEMQVWVEELEGFLRLLYAIAAGWNDEEIHEDFMVEIFKDFDIVLRGSNDLQELRDARKNRNIRRITYLQEIQRRGVLSESVDIDEEDRLLEAEEADILGRISVGAGEGDAEFDDDTLPGGGSGATTGEPQTQQVEAAD